MLVSQTDPLLPSAAEPSIFMLGGAPEAHEVLSKTPRIEILPPRKLPRGVSDQG